ncbi:Alpha/Beta hydrolase protein [Coniella lustricola]|uniref:Alpha/Beta hydrolase protein n=1 Tax=Coniella lustricola TaxID=2025994 RepID=A0A2T3A4W7_9PEZI|nr:Alpha/Beta hydrolase protein [Coniella lustricola]
MDNVQQVLAKAGNSWSQDIAISLIKAYEPLQAQANKRYSSDVKTEKAIKYGPDARHRIDVYSPAGTTGAKSRPVVVFIHGGGLVTGDNDVTPNIYGNIGNYFASRGYVTCLATYRLALQTGHHPNGAEDVASILKWVQANIANYGGDDAKVVVLGQSAGGVHVLSALFMGYLDNHSPPLMRGFISLSAPFTMDVSNPKRNEQLAEWFQDKDASAYNERYTPLALFRQWCRGDGSDSKKKLPYEIRLAIGEYDMTEATDGTFAFVNEYQNYFGRLPLLEVLKGHNHVSYSFGLGLDEDPIHETVGKALLRHIEELLQ